MTTALPEATGLPEDPGAPGAPELPDAVRLLVSLVLRVSAEHADTLSDALLEAGALSVSVEDAAAGTEAERPVFGEPGASAPLWDENLVRVLLDEPDDAPRLVRLARELCELDADPVWTLETVADTDWVRQTQSQFDPIMIDPRLWIVPSWHEPADIDAINIRLDPGLAFGTGSHPTTQLCLRWLIENVQAQSRVMDYGCGSGILAIAAARLGAAHVTGIDIDPAAIEAAADNAERNAVRIEWGTAEDAPRGPFDIVVANILANPLRLLAPALAGLLEPGGRIALAGILASQRDELMAVYADHFTMQAFAEQDGWVCLEGTRT